MIRRDEKKKKKVKYEEILQEENTQQTSNENDMEILPQIVPSQSVQVPQVAQAPLPSSQPVSKPPIIQPYYDEELEKYLNVNFIIIFKNYIFLFDYCNAYCKINLKI